MNLILKIFSALSLIIVFSISTISCTGCQDQTNKQESTEEGVDFESLNVIDSIDAIFFALPSPEEIISYISSHDVKFNGKLLHDFKKAKQYKSTHDKTIALGVYFADLAYISAFSKSDYLSDYINTIDYLLSDLNINPDFTLSQQKKIINSSLDPESLYEISQELYDTVISYLQEYDNGKTLALLSVGTLCESLYITTSLHGDFDKNKEAIDRIAEQKLLYEDIVTMMKPYQNTPETSLLYKDLKDLEQTFDIFKVETNIKKTHTAEDGSLHIAGENSISLTEEDYDLFILDIKTFRTKIIQ